MRRLSFLAGLVICVVGVFVVPAAVHAQTTCSNSWFSVTPCVVTQADTMPTRGTGYRLFQITNVGWIDDVYLLEGNCSAAMLSCDPNTPGQWVGQTWTAWVMVTYVTPSTPGNYTVGLKITSDYSTTMPPAPAVEMTSVPIRVNEAASAVVSGNREGLYAYRYLHTTPAYYTLDTPRSIGLIYHSHRAAPQVFLGMDIRLGKQSEAATSVDLSITYTSSGVPITFTNGETTLHFAGSFGGANYAYPNCSEPEPTCIEAVYGDTLARVIGQVDMRSKATGIYPITITTVLHFASGASKTFTSNTVFFFVNDNSSSIAKGWTIANLQRLYQLAPSYYLIVHNNGDLPAFYTNLNTATNDSTILTKDTIANKFTRTYPDGSAVVFNSLGQQIASTDRYGNTTTYLYDGSGRLISVRDPMWARRGNTGIHDTLTYASGSVTVQEVGIVGGRTTTYTIDGSNRLTRITDPDGYHTDFTYNANDLLTSVTNRLGHAEKLVYDSQTFQLVADTLPSVPIDTGGGSTKAGKPVVRQIPWQIAGVPQVATNSTPAPLVLPDSAYDREIDPLGRVTRIVRYSLGKPKLIVLPSNSGIGYTWNGEYPATVALGVNLIDSTRYSVRGLLLGRRPIGQSWITYHYGPYLQIDSITGANVPATWNVVNATTGNIDTTFSIRPVGASSVDTVFTAYQYDAWGRLTTRRTSSGLVDSVFYDATSGNVRRTKNIGSIAARGFDTFGRLIADSAAGRAPIATTYDIMNRVTAIDDGVNATPTRFYYDALFRTSVKNPKGEFADSVEYDALGRVIARHDTYLLSRVQTFRYDSAGQLTSWTNRRGQRIDLRYNANGQLIRRSYGSAVDTLNPWLFFGGGSAYSSEGRVDKFVDAYYNSSRTTITMAGKTYTLIRPYVPQMGDTLFQQLEINGTLDFSWRTRFHPYTGALKSVDFLPNQNPPRNQFTYASDGTLDTRTVTGSTYSGTETHTYTSRGRLTTLVTTLGPSSTHPVYWRAQFDSLDRLQAHIQPTTVGSTTATDRVAYIYDGLGRLIADSVTTNQPCGITSGSGVWDAVFGYSLRCATPTGTAYSYDAAGNRTDQSGTYGTGNRISTFKGYTFTHDEDGNLVHKTKSGVNIAYEWDELGRLRAVTDSVNNVRTQYFYDGWDRLVRRAVNGATERYFLWDDQTLVAQISSIFTVLNSYAYTGLDQPLTDRYNWQVAKDVRGNVIAWYSDAGTTRQTNTYDAWGAPAVSLAGSDPVEPLMWKGLLWEDRARVGGDGLYYMRARWYDPELGRFLSEDPMGVAGGLNLYSFGNGDPINSYDPMGSCSYGKLSAPDDFSDGPHNAKKGFILPYRDGRIKCTGDASTDPWIWVIAHLPTIEISDRLDPLAALVQTGLLLQPFEEAMEDWRTQLVIGALINPVGETAAAGQALRYTFGHGARHLVETGLEQPIVESAIMKAINTQLKGAAATVSGPFTGRISVQGILLEFRGFGRPGNIIHIGTYFPL